MWLIFSQLINNLKRQDNNFFRQGQVGLTLFPPTKWNHNLKTTFCIYLGYLCLKENLFEDLKHVSVTKMQCPMQKEEARNYLTLVFLITVHYTGKLWRST